LVCIRRQDELLVPMGETILEPGDQITVFGTDVEREEMERAFGVIECHDLSDE